MSVMNNSGNINPTASFAGMIDANIGVTMRPVPPPKPAFETPIIKAQKYRMIYSKNPTLPPFLVERSVRVVTIYYFGFAKKRNGKRATHPYPSKGGDG
jgi:hypothetical protein